MSNRLLLATCMTVMVALAGSAVVAQSLGQDINDNGALHGNNANNQNRVDHYRFSDHDRQVTRDWYNEHPKHTDRGFRDRDQLTPQYESQIRAGVVLNEDLRRMTYAVPSDLRRRLTVARPGYRYVAVGGHLVLVDNGYRIFDVVNLAFNF